MSYMIMRCKECGAFVNVHKHVGYFAIRNVCEHVPRLDKAFNSEVRRYLR